MSLILLCSTAWADRLYWTAPPSTADVAMATAAVPSATPTSLDGLGGGAVAGDPAAEITALQAEHTSVLPLFDKFDGELQIMSRLATATNSVTVLRDDKDADLLWRVLVTEGYAVRRYFQDQLGTDPGAAAYREDLAGNPIPSAWAEAIALNGARNPTEAELPDAAERLAFDTIRAAMIAQPTARIEPGVLPAGATLRVDGQALTGPSLVTAGKHRLDVAQDGLLLSVQTPTLGPGQVLRVDLPIGPKERAEILSIAKSTKDGTPTPAALQAALRGTPEAIYLGVPGARHVWRVDEGRFEEVRPPKTAASSAVAVHARLGGGWISTGDFFLQNVNDGAPYEKATVNAPGVGAGLGVTGTFGLFAVGGGVDGMYSIGDYHSLPSGTLDTRLFGWVHANVGLPWVQLAVGPLFPWYVGIGGQARVPIYSRVELQAGGVYGLPVTLDRGDDPAFTPTAAYTAWAGVGFKLN